MFEQAKMLPEPLAQEALDSILFLRERQEWHNLMDAQSMALGDIWDIAESVYRFIRAGRQP